MIDWNDFQYVMALHEGRTMKHAAALLGADATTVSRHIRRMTKEQGALLFTKSKNGEWEITKEGLRLVEIGNKIRSNLANLDSVDVQSSETETITVSSLEFLLARCLAPTMNEFANKNSNIKLNLIGSDKRLSLAYGEVDLAIRFGRPQEGQLIANKIAEIPYSIWTYDGADESEWVGLESDLDWTPEMKLGLNHFGKEPITRVSSFAAAKRASLSLGHPFIGPSVVVEGDDGFAAISNAEWTSRDVWCVIHETKRHSENLGKVKDWVKQSVRQHCCNQRAIVESSV